MVEAKSKLSSHWWWFDSHGVANPKRSPWLQSTLAELDEKAEAMLKLVEEDADSFAQRAELYYRKRPELISMVEDFYRAYRSLAERYDQVKSEKRSENGVRPWASPLSFVKYRTEKLMPADKAFDSFSDISDLYDPESGQSEVDDPEQDEEEQSGVFQDTMEEEEDVVVVASSATRKDEVVMKIREELEKLKEENKIQKEQLIQKDEEKREVIRQLSLAVELVKEENSKLRKIIAKDNSPTPSKPKRAFQFDKLKDAVWGKLFN